MRTPKKQTNRDGKPTARGLAGAVLAAVLVLGAADAIAAPVVLAGVDADDHGSATTTANQGGWLFLQNALESIAPSVANGHLRVVNLGSSGGSAQAAAASAYGFSDLVAGGWTFHNVDGATAVADFLAGTGAVNIHNTGILMLDSGIHVSGGATSAEQALVAAHATALASFLEGGGGLLSQANEMGWASSLLPGMAVHDHGTSGADDAFAFTPEGSLFFPGTLPGDVSENGHFHSSFSGSFGGLTVLGDSALLGHAVLLGGDLTVRSSGQTVPTPEPSAIALFGLGVAGLLGLRARRRKRVAAGRASASA